MFAACHREYGWIGWLARITAYVFLFLTVLGLIANLLKPSGVDFVSYWAAGVLTIDGNPAGSYDVNFLAKKVLRSETIGFGWTLEPFLSERITLLQSDKNVLLVQRR